MERPADEHVDLRHGVRRQPLDVRLPSRLTMTIGHRPLPEAGLEGIKERQRAAPRSENVNFRMRFGHAAVVLDDVPGAEPALENHLSHARVQ